AEWPAIGQAQLAAFIRAVTRFAQIVLEILERNCLVVALDGEDLAQNAFQADWLALFGRNIELQETVVGPDLHIGEGRHFDGVAKVAKIANLLRDDRALRLDRHGSCSSLVMTQKQKGTAAR